MIIYAIISTLLIIIIVVTWNTYLKVFHKRKKSVAEEMNKLIDKNLITSNYYEDLKLTKIVTNSLDNLNLAGYLVKCKNPIGCVILSHGISNNHVTMISHVEFFRKKNYDVLLIDQRGHCNSSPTISTYGFKERKDITQWMKYLKSLGYDNIGIMGHSMGASIALLTCAEVIKPNFIISESGYSNLHELVAFQIRAKKMPPLIFVNTVSLVCKIFNDFWLSDIDVLGSIRNTKVPILFIHGERDSLVPCSMSKRMAKATNSKLFIVKNCEHSIFKNIEYSLPEYENLISDFLLNI